VFAVAAALGWPIVRYAAAPMSAHAAVANWPTTSGHWTKPVPPSSDYRRHHRATPIDRQMIYPHRNRNPCTTPISCNSVKLDTVDKPWHEPSCTATASSAAYNGW